MNNMYGLLQLSCLTSNICFLQCLLLLVHVVPVPECNHPVHTNLNLMLILETKTGHYANIQVVSQDVKTESSSQVNKYKSKHSSTYTHTVILALYISLHLDVFSRSVVLLAAARCGAPPHHTRWNTCTHLTSRGGCSRVSINIFLWLSKKERNREKKSSEVKQEGAQDMLQWFSNTWIKHWAVPAVGSGEHPLTDIWRWHWCLTKTLILSSVLLLWYDKHLTTAKESIWFSFSLFIHLILLWRHVFSFFT